MAHYNLVILVTILVVLGGWVVEDTKFFGDFWFVECVSICINFICAVLDSAYHRAAQDTADEV